MKNFETIKLHVADSVATITLDRPDVSHAINLKMAQELLAAAVHCDEEADVRAVLLTAEGPMFCAGGDIKSFAGYGEHMPAHIKTLTIQLHAAISRFARMDAPLVTSVNGVAAGAGMSLACAGDIVLAARSAVMTPAYTRLGLAPDGGLTYTLPRVVGVKKALELILTNPKLQAADAAALGLVSQVVPDEELPSRARALAQQLAEGPTKAFGISKRLVYDSWNESLESQMERETAAIADMARSPEAAKALAAFLEKRPFSFK